MAKKEVRWKKNPAREDYGAALNYLSLVCPLLHANTLIRGLRSAKTVEHAAKDLLRASGLALLAREEPHVADDLKRIHKAKPLSPILLIQGNMGKHIPLVVADGFHRICAIYYYNESSPIPCRIITA